MTNTQLWQRREKALGPTYSHFYEEPLNLVKGEGVWLYDEKGNKYLDCYNNVVSVGHCNANVLRRCAIKPRPLIPIPVIFMKI